MNIEKSISKLKRQITAGKCEKNIGIPVFISDLETLLTAYEKEKEKNKEYKNLLIDMVNQFAYEDNKPKIRDSSEQKIYTVGLSTLEDAFDLLDIDEGIKRKDLWKLKEE
jgi:hypothetical protein